ncbi:YheU family protein [Endozoicomonas gorgoniicola]|uniref:YheU family protein n=1 Tax=Endozoicomonas gorgoniicola TaxID=1234144 RepID=A0ABT3MUP9_9GAMM|nr:YheU family protein [Endozoicomonas gorgoniicola]MCW7553088.1 YheU family protein [Endozoicomonas gorgoniicola]
MIVPFGMINKETLRNLLEEFVMPILSTHSKRRDLQVSKVKLSSIVISLILITCPLSASDSGSDELMTVKLYAALAAYNLAPQLANSFVSEIMIFFDAAPNDFIQFLQDASSLIIGYSPGDGGGVNVHTVGFDPTTVGQIIMLQH